MNRETQIIREVSIEAEDFYQDAVDLGKHAAKAFQALGRSKKNDHRSQMTGLENIAESTFKTSDVFDYIKKQTARHDYWRHAVPDFKQSNQGFGEHLADYLENGLVEHLKKACTRLAIGDEDKQERRRIYLLLIRQFIRSLVIEYEYQVSEVSALQRRRER